MYKIKTYDNVAKVGRDVFEEAKNYVLADEISSPDGILVHSTPS